MQNQCCSQVGEGRTLRQKAAAQICVAFFPRSNCMPLLTGTHPLCLHYNPKHLVTSHHTLCFLNIMYSPTNNNGETKCFYSQIWNTTTLASHLPHLSLGMAKTVLQYNLNGESL